jgi:tartrate-resistant acid phosphatase type 5
MMQGMAISEVHREPFLHLVDVAHDRALIAWGAFFFTRTDSGRWRILDDGELGRVGRRGSIGSSAEPYGASTVQLFDAAGRVVAEESTADRTWAWVEGLTPDTDYRYRVLVDGNEWAAGERWDWLAQHQRRLRPRPSRPVVRPPLSDVAAPRHPDRARAVRRAR